MSKNIAKLLAKPEKEIIKAIRTLEEKSGYPSEDVRLSAENKQKVRAKVLQLGLDPDDTTDEELYYALLTRFKNDSDKLDSALGVSESTGSDEKISKAIQLVSHCVESGDVWVLKNSVIKATLTKNPPKKVAKKLNYRSVASLIKRENITEVYLAAQYLESSAWRKNLAHLLAKKGTSNYELRPITITKLAHRKWGEIEGLKASVISDSTIGAVALWPLRSLEKTSVLNLTLLILDGLRRINPSGHIELLHELSPALRWWSDNAYLIWDGDNPLSFNLKDVALNYMKNNNVDESKSHHGSEAFWQELTRRYGLILNSLSEDIPDIGYNFYKTKKAPVLPVNDELATEYIAVE